ncbi:SRPBCC family protein [Luteimonas sp. MC1750]|uniref:SRPBCC family protein n=1 Tax=Luteimonas sp. MC1750 TaxID=2799326 RepID=UPI0018F107E6|nr:SRPBCC family protein [Luteimonas sp. MC1750]MBJ6983887.1 SRPBCC family protein [Luteimonas sp. MC1750]QQO06707.1 SRPBCC family protein [Luteimonas sp. MC1750]
MTRLLELLISMAIVAVLFLIVGVVLPSSRSLSESVETNRRMSIVFDTVNSFKRFDDWHPFALGQVKLNRSGPDEGVGARIEYDSEVSGVGKGSWEIVESEQDSRVVYRIDDENRGSNKQSTITLKPTGRGGRNVEITQDYSIDYGWDLLGRYAGLYVSRNVGDTMKFGLGRLTNMLAAVPNFDYRVDGSNLANLEIAQIPAENLLVVNAGAIERNNEVVKKAMKDNAEWIKRTMDESGLEPIGPLRIVTTEFARDTYTFDVVQAVRRKGGAAAPAADAPAADADADESAEAPAARPAFAVTDSEPMDAEGVKLLGPVTFVRSEPTRVARADYTGYMAELDVARNATRAWALTQGEEAIGRPYEYYVNGIDAAFTADGQFKVFWNLKG